MIDLTSDESVREQCKSFAMTDIGLTEDEAEMAVDEFDFSY